VSFIVCVALCAVFCLSVVCYLCDSVLCLIRVPQPPDKSPFAVQINNNIKKIIIIEPIFLMVTDKFRNVTFRLCNSYKWICTVTDALLFS
jgi:hypothetical protein